MLTSLSFPAATTTGVPAVTRFSTIRLTIALKDDPRDMDTILLLRESVEGGREEEVSERQQHVAGQQSTEEKTKWREVQIKLPHYI